MSTATQNLLTIGRLCELLQVAPTRVQEAAAAIGVAPVVRIDGIPYFEEDDFERLAATLKTRPTRPAVVRTGRASRAFGVGRPMC